MNKIYIKGNYKRSIFTSNNGYVIGLFKVKDTNDEELEIYINKTITFTGYFAELNEDDLYIFYGELIEHPKYGTQFQVTEYERVKPDDKDGIVAFLSSDLFKGVGDKLATQIVNVLGDDTLDKILEEKESLLLVPKMTSKKMNLIYETLVKYEESHKKVIYLTELGFSMKDALSIYNYYKEDTILALNNDIYKIIDDIEDINFLKIDKISYKLEYEVDDSRRIKACIIYAMNNLSFKQGDTYSYFEEIKKEVELYLKIYIDENDFINYLDSLRFENKIVLQDDKYYLKNMYEDEKLVAEEINYLINKEKTTYKKLDNYLSILENENNIIYNDEQKEAIKKSLENNILIITGGPGTGKTTIIKTIVDLYQSLNKYTNEQMESKLALLAPTGRASKRMCESTFFKATTIHRFLKWNKENNEFLVNEYNKSKSELIIIDEVSMIDTNLFASLFRGITRNVKIVLVGDYNQLPSVGAGQILKDLIESRMVDTVELDLLYRQDENSYINILASEIKDNNLSEDFKNIKEDFAFLECKSEVIKNSIKDIALKFKEKGYTYKEFQFLAPMYAGVNGIDNLNKILQNIFNPKDESKKELNYGDVIYRENDKILQLVNMPDENVFNGDVGIIKEIIPYSKSESKKNEIYVDYDGTIVKYLPNDYSKIKHGFITSIHKSQGSEFNLVVIPICFNYQRMLYRKLIYTAITRAKKRLIILGETNAFLYAVKNDEEIIRKTSLKENLINMNK